MNKTGLRRSHVVDYAAAAIEQMDLYCTAHPGSPSALRRPKVFFRSDLWVALLGPTTEEGIVGIGPNIAAALERLTCSTSPGCVHLTRRSDQPLDQAAGCPPGAETRGADDRAPYLNP
jgi:hypothetical protein